MTSGHFTMVFDLENSQKILDAMNKMLEPTEENKLFTYDGERYQDGPALGAPGFNNLTEAFNGWNLTYSETCPPNVLIYGFGVTDNKSIIWLMCHIAPHVVHGTLQLKHDDGSRELYTAWRDVTYSRGQIVWKEHERFDVESFLKKYQEGTT